MTCIKTGARVYLASYNQTVPADLHQVGGCTIVHMNMSLFDTKDSNWSMDGATHVVSFPPSTDSIYFNKDAGIVVVPNHYIDKVGGSDDTDT